MTQPNEQNYPSELAQLCIAVELIKDVIASQAKRNTSHNDLSIIRTLLETRTKAFRERIGGARAAAVIAQVVKNAKEEAKRL